MSNQAVVDDPCDDDWSQIWAPRHPCGCCTCCEHTCRKD